MRNLLVLPLIIAASLFVQASDVIESLAEKKCGTCHLMGKVTKEKLNKMAAPPYWALAKKVKVAYPNRLDGIDFIINYTLNPSEDKMLFPKETKERFGVMPSQKDALTEDELRAIATYILDK
ncbi:MAG: cytochrome c [Sulfurimonas sp.]|jgi:mono/diheme cytochrome c family protein|nr:cytochrome c [Sulfurimonas sp.]